MDARRIQGFAHQPAGNCDLRHIIAIDHPRTLALASTFRFRTRSRILIAMPVRVLTKEEEFSALQSTWQELFDSNPNNISLLLPLLWDGGLHLSERDLKLGRVVIVLAGSNSSLPRIMDQARSMRQGLSLEPGTNPKIVDLLSRINGGVVEIPPFEQVNPPVERLVDKACIAIQLLRRQFGLSLRTVPLGLLQFIVRTDFRYGVRSIDHLIGLIPPRKNLVHLTSTDLLALPMKSIRALKESSLAYHVVHHKDPKHIVDAWHEAKDCSHRLLVSASRSATYPKALEPEASKVTLVEFVRRMETAIDSDKVDEGSDISSQFLMTDSTY